MKQQKPNMTQWYLLGLAMLLSLGGLISAVGIGYARYRTESQASIYFAAKAPAPVWLGSLTEPAEDGTVSFVATGAGSWVTEENQSKLKFAVANGTSAADFANEDLRVRVRLIGSLGLWNGEAPLNMRLSVPENEDSTKVEEILATAERILPESPLYDTFGDGWTFTFRDAAGKELSWILEGGDLSFIEMVLTQEGAGFIDTSLIQLQVSAETIRK